ncbi:MAG: tetratricopeptide repeat protein [Ardenticatenaceae bacterium]
MITKNRKETIHSPNKRYILHETLGKGGMGVVYRATDRLNGQEVALKQVYLPPEQLDFIPKGRRSALSLMSPSASMTTQNLRLALAQEFQTLATLRHPHIISVLDYGFGQDGQPYFTMNLLEEAQTILEAGKMLDLAGKIRLISQMLQALAYLHRRCILHRDLKPSNVLVSEGSVRVLDFGLSAAKEEAQSSSGGTLAYMAPELLLGQSASSEASDLYAVGVIAYELLLARPPFDHNGKYFFEQVLKQTPDLSALDAPLAEVIGILLKKQPQERYASAEASLAAFSQALGQPLPAESVTIRESYLQAATFVGREDEIATLTKALQEAQAGKGSAWLVGGESGVGKSRLIDELRIQALVEGCLVLHGQAERDGGGLPYELWREPLRHLVVGSADLDDLSAAVLQPLLPDIEQLLARPIAPAPILEAEAAQQRLFSTMASLFGRASQPIVLILEDLQWSQEGLSPLPYLTRQIADTPLLILGTYRDDERPDLPSILKEWQVMSLPRLSEASIAELSSAILGEVGLQTELLALLQRETEGNAFFLVEVVRALAEDAGRLGGIANMSLPEKVMPQGIATIVQRRLARVPKAAHQLLNLAAVAGRALDLAVMEAFATETCPEERGINMHNWWLPVCANAAVLELQHNRWQFTHDKIREGLLASLSAETLMAHHRQIAQTIEQIYPNEPNQAAQLMYHWAQVGDRVKERDYAYVAGTHAASRYANQDALTYLSRCYQLTATKEVSQRYEILLAREKIYALLGQSEAQEAELTLLTQIAEAIGQPKESAEVALRQANLAIVTSDYPAAIRHAQLAIPQAQQTGESLLLTQAHRLWGESLTKQGNYEQATSQFEQALMIAKLLEANPSASSEPHVEIAELLGHLGNVASRKGDFDQAIEYFEESLAIHRAIDNRQGEAQAYCWLGQVAFDRAAYPQARSYLQRSLAIFQEIGDKQGESHALNTLGMLHGEQRDDLKAQRYFEEALAIEQSIGNKNGIGMMLNNLGVSASNQRHYKKAYNYFASSLIVVEETGDKLGQATTLTNMGRIFPNQKGVYAQAKRHLEQSLALTQEMQAKEPEGAALMHLGGLFNRLGRYSEALPYLESSLAINQALGTRRWEGWTLIFLAECLMGQKSYPQANSYLDQALAINQEINNKPKVGISLNNLAWIAYQMGDYDQMKAHYQAALTAFEGFDELHDIATAQAGLAWAHLLQGKRRIEECLAPSLAYLHENPNLMEPDSPFRVYLLSYWSLHATNDHRAREVLAKGYQRLQQLAQNIIDPSWRYSFLEDVPEHREMVRLFENASADDEVVSAQHPPQDSPPTRSLSDLLAEIISQMGAERGYILLRQADGSLDSALGTPSLSENDMISSAIIHKVIQNKKELVIRNAMTDRHFARAKSIMKGRIRSVLCVPLREKEQAIGAIYLEHRSKRGKFGQQDLVAVEGLAQEVAEAMSKRR